MQHQGHLPYHAVVNGRPGVDWARALRVMLNKPNWLNVRYPFEKTLAAWRDIPVERYAKIVVSFSGTSERPPGDLLVINAA